MISAVIPLQDATYVDSPVSRTIMKRDWKQLDTSALKRDLLASDIVNQPIVDCDNFFDTYDRCLRTLVDKHCRLVKAATRRLKKAYRHTRTEIA